MKNPPVALSVNVPVELWDWKTKTTSPLAEPVALPPTQNKQITEFLSYIAPNQKIEKLGRTESVSVKYVGESSLLFQGVHKCFADHHALALRPEVFHYMLMATVAQTVKDNPDTYKHLFTRSESKEKTHIEVEHNGLVLGGDSPWHEVFPMFNEAFQKLVPSQELLAAATKEYSLHTDEIMAATMVTFMDAASPFYEYGVTTCCGIPRILLLGTKADYRALVHTAAQLHVLFAEHLSGYFDRVGQLLMKIASECEAAAPDVDFWKSIYKHHGGSGTNRADGWLTHFLHYANVRGVGIRVRSDGHVAHGIEIGEIPSHVSSVDFTWTYYNEKYPMHFLGGVLGLGCTTHEGVQYMTPELSYAVTHAAPKG